MNKVTVIISVLHKRVGAREMLAKVAHVDTRCEYPEYRITVDIRLWSATRISAWMFTVFGDTWTYFVSVSPTSARARSYNYIGLSRLLVRPTRLDLSSTFTTLETPSRLRVSSALVRIRSIDAWPRGGRAEHEAIDVLADVYYWRLINKWPITPGDIIDERTSIATVYKNTSRYFSRDSVEIIFYRIVYYHENLANII